MGLSPDPDPYIGIRVESGVSNSLPRTPTYATRAELPRTPPPSNAQPDRSALPGRTPIPVRARWCVPRLPVLADPFGEERLRAQPEGLCRGLAWSGASPAPWLVSAVAGAAVGDGAAARAAGRSGGA